MADNVPDRGGDGLILAPVSMVISEPSHLVSGGFNGPAFMGCFAVSSVRAADRVRVSTAARPGRHNGPFLVPWPRALAIRQSREMADSVRDASQPE